LATASFPEVVLTPFQAPAGVLVAVHVVAFVLDQVSVTVPPEAIEAADEFIATVGAGVDPGVVGGGVGESLPPPPQPASEQAEIDASVKLATDKNFIGRSESAFDSGEESRMRRGYPLLVY
jgi:hypothetical protein